MRGLDQGAWIKGPGSRGLDQLDNATELMYTDNLPRNSTWNL